MTPSQQPAHERTPGEARLHAVPEARRVAYFSMEIALDAALPTYSGGLGILAGDMLRSAADLGLPTVAVTLLYRDGYFAQSLDAAGNQSERAEKWDPRTRLVRSDRTARIQIEGRDVEIAAWRYDLVGQSGFVVPVYLLDTDLEGNDPYDRSLTNALYGGDGRYRLCQEAVLGYGGYAMLEALGAIESIATFHMNEGHSALLVSAALEARLHARGVHEPTSDDLATVRRRFAFTTHTPVPAGHDRFDRALSEAVLGAGRTALIERVGGLRDGFVNMTYLALRGSSYVNGVAMRHAEVSRALFPGDPIHAITNGVHAVRWTAPSFATLFDRHMPEWRTDNDYLRHAVGIPLDESAPHIARRRINSRSRCVSARTWSSTRRVLRSGSRAAPQNINAGISPFGTSSGCAPSRKMPGRCSLFSPGKPIRTMRKVRTSSSASSKHPRNSATRRCGSSISRTTRSRSRSGSSRVSTSGSTRRVRRSKRPGRAV
jgi:alpha-glucan phosphorylase-like protein